MGLWTLTAQRLLWRRCMLWKPVAYKPRWLRWERPVCVECVCVCVYLACSMGLFLFNVCMCPCRAHFSNIIRLFIWPQLTSCSSCDPVLLTFAVETRCCFHSNNLWDRLHTFSFSSSLFLFFLFFFFLPASFFSPLSSSPIGRSSVGIFWIPIITKVWNEVMFCYWKYMQLWQEVVVFLKISKIILCQPTDSYQRWCWLFVYFGDWNSEFLFLSDVH